jgi:hypothetical protein
VSTPLPRLQSATRQIDAGLSALLQRLQPGQRIRITQTVRVGQKSWNTTVTGTFRKLNYLVTGLATDRVREDEIVVICVHFTKDNGELSSVTLDEQSKVELIEG